MNNDSKLDLAKYDYLDHIHIEGYYWEIIRRTSVYISSYKYLSKPNIDIELAKNLLTDALSTGIKQYVFEEHFGVIEDSFKILIKDAWLFGKIDNKVFFLPNPQLTSKELTKNNEYALQIIYPGIQLYEAEYMRSIINLSEDEKNNTLSSIFTNDCEYWIGIPKNFAVSGTYESIKFVLQGLSSKSSTSMYRKRVKLWKYYLIVYDLHKLCISYPEIAHLLSTYYSTKKLDDEKNIENYNIAAVDLIHGGYKKYF
jgi:hypothetical protein